MCRAYSGEGNDGPKEMEKKVKLMVAGTESPPILMSHSIV